MVLLALWLLPCTWASAQPEARRADLIERAVSDYACVIEPVIAPPPEGAESSLTADNAVLDEQGVAHASGNVRLERGTQALQAPTLSDNRKTSRTQAPNGLRYYRPGVNLEARSADVNIDQRSGRFEQARYGLPDSGARGNARRVESFGSGRLQLTDADYSTCPGRDTAKAWRLTAERIELDRASGRGQAYDAVLRLFDWPVLYTPYIDFPIDDRRHTGFLLPTFATSSDRGVELAAPYYINLAPDYDLTLTPRVMTDRGLQVAGQFRYLREHAHGTALAEYLPSDTDYGDDRYLYELRHQGRLGEHFALGVDYTRVSDDAYFDDLSSQLSRSSQSQLPQRARLSFAAPGVRFAARVQEFQTLDDEDNNALFRLDPYEQRPQARLSLASPTAPLRIGLDAEAANFDRDNSVTGTRYHLRPRLSLATDRGGWYAHSQASYRYTRYRLDNVPAGVDERAQREVFGASAEVGLRLQRRLDNGWLQTLEPRAFYLYNGFDDQDDLPLFDTGVPDLHFERLFADNRFVGTDRIGDANQLTLGLTSRLIDPTDGRTVARFDLGRIYGFSPLDVRLPGRSPVGFGERHSDVVAGVEYNPWTTLHSGLVLQYDPDDARVNRAGLRAGYRDDAGRRLDIGYRLYRNYRPLDRRGGRAGLETLRQTDLLFTLPLTDRLAAFGRWNYSLENSRNVETLGGLQYRASCCWAVRGALRRYLRDDFDNNESDYDTAFLLQIELTGLGQFGDDIDTVLEREENSVDSGINGFIYP